MGTSAVVKLKRPSAELNVSGYLFREGLGGAGPSEGPSQATEWPGRSPYPLAELATNFRHSLLLASAMPHASAMPQPSLEVRRPPC